VGEGFEEPHRAVKFMHCLPAFHDPNTVVGREIMEHGK
jgi:ornithine carbamoyltransferase